MGGNAKIANTAAMHLNLEHVARSKVQDVITDFLNVFNSEVSGSSNTAVWNDCVSPVDVLSGSSAFLFDQSISDSSLQAEYPLIGDIDIQVPAEHATKISEWVSSLPVLDRFKCIGVKPGNSQIVSLWEFVDLNLTLQVDFEFVVYENGKPSEWSRFSRASSFDDVLYLKTKGVHHKWFLQSLTRANRDLIEVIHRGKRATLEECHYTLAVTSNEGGGLRRKFFQLPVEDERLFVAAPKSRYVQNCKTIFETLLGEGYDHKQHFIMLQSLHGAVILANTLLTPDQKMKVFVAFAEKCFGSTSQAIIRDNQMLDLEKKQNAMNYVSKEFDFPNVVFYVKE